MLHNIDVFHKGPNTKFPARLKISHLILFEMSLLHSVLVNFGVIFKNDSQAEMLGE